MQLRLRIWRESWILLFSVFIRSFYWPASNSCRWLNLKHGHTRAWHCLGNCADCIFHEFSKINQLGFLGDSRFFAKQRPTATISCWLTLARQKTKHRSMGKPKTWHWPTQNGRVGAGYVKFVAYRRDRQILSYSARFWGGLDSNFYERYFFLEYTTTATATFANNTTYQKPNAAIFCQHFLAKMNVFDRLKKPRSSLLLLKIFWTTPIIPAVNEFFDSIKRNLTPDRRTKPHTPTRVKMGPKTHISVLWVEGNPELSDDPLNVEQIEDFQIEKHFS
jgi:hypothetical protein